MTKIKFDPISESFNLKAYYDLKEFQVCMGALLKKKVESGNIDFLSISCKCYLQIMLHSNVHFR